MIDAIEAAHDHGIVHRDLKPANIKVTPEGRVKVLDFGLARLMSASGERDADPASAAAGVTQNGALLGTAPYMSPEQARGRTADKRSDIWAFGCVLYEMLAGAPAFAGDGPPISWPTSSRWNRTGRLFRRTRRRRFGCASSAACRRISASGFTTSPMPAWRWKAPSSSVP